MKWIPDTPRGMGNANDWMQERERRGFPQNRTVSIEHTVYHNDETSKLVDELHDAYEEIITLNGLESYEEGYADGYHDAIEDVKDALKTDLTEKRIKDVFTSDPCGLSVEERYTKIKPIVTRFATIIVRKKDSK